MNTAERKTTSTEHRRHGVIVWVCIGVGGCNCGCLYHWWMIVSLPFKIYTQIHTPRIQLFQKTEIEMSKQVQKIKVKRQQSGIQLEKWGEAEEEEEEKK